MASDKMFDKTLLNLQILGQLKEHDKIYSNDGYFEIFGPYKTEFLFRWMYSEKRKENIKDVEEVIENAFTLLVNLNILTSDNLSNNSNPMEKELNKKKNQRLREALRSATVGLRNLCTTYVDDRKTVQMIKNLITNVEDRLEVTKFPMTTSTTVVSKQ